MMKHVKSWRLYVYIIVFISMLLFDLFAGIDSSQDWLSPPSQHSIFRLNVFIFMAGVPVVIVLIAALLFVLCEPATYLDFDRFYKYIMYCQLAYWVLASLILTIWDGLVNGWYLALFVVITCYLLFFSWPKEKQYSSRGC